MEMPRDYPPLPASEPIEPVTRKRTLKAYSKGDLIRYVLQLEDRLDRARSKIEYGEG